VPKERIQPEGLTNPPAYAQVVKAGNTVYLAGQTAIDARGQVVGRGDITAQTTQVFENIKKALKSARADFSDVVKITVYITDPRFREPAAEVRKRYFTDSLPASTLLVVTGLASPDYLIEVDVIAVVD
jgi:reactive intermediate/imine deaminase